MIEYGTHYRKGFHGNKGLWNLFRDAVLSGDCNEIHDVLDARRKASMEPTSFNVGDFPQRSHSQPRWPRSSRETEITATWPVREWLAGLLFIHDIRESQRSGPHRDAIPWRKLAR